jgi:hypothetical protein
MNDKQIIKKIIEKKEFSELPIKDVEKAFSKFNRPNYLDEEKIKFTRDLLRKIYSVFLSKKLLVCKEKDFEWFLNKHISTRERFQNYLELYKRIFANFGKNLFVYDLGCGINGFSYPYFKKINKNVFYLGIEAINQLVRIQNEYFKKNKFSARIFHESLFNIPNIKKILKYGKNPKIIFLFKIFDSLEMLEKDFSKKLLMAVVPCVDLVIISFATRSLVARKKFRSSRNWIFSFVQKNFQIIDDFELSSERYISFRKR